jgi:hypothetical protein
MGRTRSAFQQELLKFLQPWLPRRADLLSERIAPVLAEVARRHAHRPADQVLAALEAVVVGAGGTPDMHALREFAADIEAGENPFE